MANTTKKKKQIIISSIVGAIICVVLGLLSGYFTATEIGSWYTTINKPSWNPPNWIFGPMWTTLYILMGVAVGRIWHKSGQSEAFWLFVIQFVLNLAWSFLFFYLHGIGTALVDIILLVLFLVFTIRAFYKIDRLAAYLLIPYLMWVLFATTLNATIYSLNM